MHIFYTKIRKMHVFFDGNTVSEAVDGKLSCPCHGKVKSGEIGNLRENYTEGEMWIGLSESRHISDQTFIANIQGKDKM